MKTIILIFSLFIISHIPVLAGNPVILSDSSKTVSTSDTLLTEKVILDSILLEKTESLLPSNYLFTQRLLWGKSGLLRNLDNFKLSEESRYRELDIREKMFTAHRYIGYATMAGMIAQGIVGERLYMGNNSLKDIHSVLAGAINIGYFTTAGLAFFAPPRMKDRAKGFSVAKLHKYLSIVHFSSMVATNILSGLTEDNPKIKPYHRATAFVAYGAYFASLIVIHF